MILKNIRANTTYDWHLKLRHISKKDFLEMTRKEFMCGIKEYGKFKTYETCIEGKMPSLAFIRKN